MIAVLTMRAPGWVRRFASGPVAITGDTSGAPTFAPAGLVGFEPPEEEVDLLGVDRSEITSARVSIVLERGESGPAMEAAFGHLSAAAVDLDLYDEGADWSTRERLIAGGVVSHLTLEEGDPDAGSDAGPVASFTAEAANPAAGAGVGDAQRDMGAYYGGTPTGSGTGGTLGYPSLVGRQWPTIVGAVYGVPGHKLGIDLTGTPFIALGLAGHHMPISISSVTFYLDGEAWTPTGTLSIVNDFDPAGDPVCYVASTSTTHDFVSADGSYSVDLPYGAVGLDGGSPAYSGGDVLRWFLRASGVAVDWTRCEPALAALAAYRIGVYIDDETDVLKVLRERLLKVLPLIEERGPDGLWLRLTDYRIAPTVAHLEEGVHLIDWTSGLVQDSDPDDIRNRFVANYAYSHQSSSYTGRIVIDGDSHPGCAASRTLYGERLADDIDLSITWDAATASRILTAYADRLSMTRFTRGALLDPSMDAVQAGDVVTITSARAGWTRRRCLIRSRVAPMAGEAIPVTVEPLPISAVLHGS